MNIALKRFIGKSRALLVAVAAVLLVCRNAGGQVLVSNWSSLNKALQTSTAVTNFVTNSVISLSSVIQTLEIENDATVLIDGGTNNIVIDGGGAARLFRVFPNCQLTLKNLQLINGIGTAGGAIFNEGTLIISNCILSGNAATNVTGVNGTANTSGGNGSSAGSGGSAIGGAIYSTGPVIAINSVFGTNSAAGGTGGTGGDGAASAFFGGNGGNGGSGGSAQGAAIFSSGSSNVFIFDEFIDNQCIAGSGGGGGAGGGGSFDAGSTGQGGTGGAATGGALCIAGNLYINNCLFYLNSVAAGTSAGAQVSFTGSGSDGSAGGEAIGGGIFVSAAAAQFQMTNTVFFNNSCVGGGGGSAGGQSATGGSGGAAIGGGLDSAAAHAIVRFCTLATNTLAGGTNGTGSGGSGSVGGTAGWDICVSGGVLEMSDSILSGGTNVAPNNFRPNAFSVTDGGYNFSSDASMAKLTSTTLIDTAAFLDSALSPFADISVGPANVSDPQMLTLALLGGPAASFIPGIAGVTFPGTDQQLQDRNDPTCAGAFELNPITISSNVPLPIITTQPRGLTNKVGTAATFTVAVSDTNSVGYQWQLNSNNLADNATFAGVNTGSLTVREVTLANQGFYRVIVGVSTQQGVATSSNVLLAVIAPPKIAVQPARKPPEPDGGIVSFRVIASGAEPLSFQWRNGSQNLSDGGAISGSMTSNLTINPASFSEAGTYSVVITNAYGAITSVPVPLAIVADKIRPTVSITSPAANSRASISTITGKAADNAQVTNVFWWITNINAGTTKVISGNAILETNGTASLTWSIIGGVSPGTNIVRVQSADFSGNLSPIVTRKFFIVSPSLFELAMSGPGTVKGHAAIAGNVPPTNGAMLNIGEGYTLTATAEKGAVFVNWTSNGAPSSSPTLHFIMEPGLEIAAYFTNETAAHAEEIYNGLFYDETNGVSEKTAGMLSQLTVDSTGAYSGKLLLNGINYTLAGKFDGSGGANALIARSPENGGPVKLRMSLQGTNGQIDGVVSGADPDEWISTLFAEAADTNPVSTKYTLLLLSSTNAESEIPQGNGYLLLTNGFGQLICRGLLADGTVFSQSTPVGRLGDAPLFASLYRNTGLVLGWISLSNGTVHAVTPLAWIKTSSLSGPLANGFTNLLSVTNAPQDVSSPATPADSKGQ